MSEKEIIGEKLQNSNNIDSKAIPTNADESNKIFADHDGELNSIDTIQKEHSDKSSTEQPIANDNAMDVLPEESKGGPTELHKTPPAELKSADNESPIDEQNEHRQLAMDHMVIPIADTVICNESVCINIDAPLNDSANTDTKIQQNVTQINAVTANVGVAQQKTPKPHTIAHSIGSLGLLNQYVSSSDDDDDEDSSDSSSESDDSESETGTESDDDDDDSSDNSNDVSNNVELLDASAVTKDNQLNALAKNILNDVMSRNSYREASSDT